MYPLRISSPRDDADPRKPPLAIGINPGGQVNPALSKSFVSHYGILDEKNTAALA